MRSICKIKLIQLVESGLNNVPVITKADAVQFDVNVYGGINGPVVQKLDFIRIVLMCILLAVIPLRIFQKYKNSEQKGKFVLLNYSFRVILQVKNIILIVSFAFLINAFINFITYKIDPLAYHTNGYFKDIYMFATQQKYARTIDELSCYLIMIHSLKYFQYFKSLNIFYIALKKSSLEYFTLLVTILVIFLGLSLLTNFVFGTYIYEYKTFVESVATNIKVFIFIDNTSIIKEFFEIYSTLSIIFLIIFVFLIRFYLLNLFYPIFIEYYKNEMEKFHTSRKELEMLSKDRVVVLEKYTTTQSKFLIKFLELKLFMWPYRVEEKKKKTDDLYTQIKEAIQKAEEEKKKAAGEIEMGKI
jgi:hypothetical protein